MKLKIEQKFQDKYNGTIYEAGDVIEFETARGEELLADKRGLVSLVDEVIEDAVPEEVVEEVVAEKPKRKSAKK